MCAIRLTTYEKKHCYFKSSNYFFSVKIEYAQVRLWSVIKTVHLITKLFFLLLTANSVVAFNCN